MASLAELRESGISVKHGLYGERGKQIGMDFCLKFQMDFEHIISQVV